MELVPRGQAEARCPYCHGPFGDEPLLECLRCRTSAHVDCVGEHGGCPTLGCQPPSPPRGATVTWEQFVEEARPWLETGAGLLEHDAWGAPSDLDPALFDSRPEPLELEESRAWFISDSTRGIAAVYRLLPSESRGRSGEGRPDVAEDPSDE